MGITQRTVTANFEHSKGRFSTRKLIPVNSKTMGDHLLLKRIEANLSQPEVAVKAGVSVRTVKRGNMTNCYRPKPNGRSWLTSWLTSCDWIRHVQKVETHHQSPVMAFTQSLGRVFLEFYIAFQPNFPNSRSSPSRIVSGCGGQPGMNKSTGTMEFAPFRICGWPMNGPPAIAHAPTAMTIFGDGTAS
jgi:hypothetical protein